MPVLSPGAPTMKLTDIQMRDPFVVPVKHEQAYYIFGTTDGNCWGTPYGADCWRSTDLVECEGPIPAFRPPEGFWATRHFWAPEVHHFNGRWYLFMSFKAEDQYRGTQILAADAVTGPFVPLTERPITPPDWECLDGTLHVDTDGAPWIVFCHEWVQVHNGAMVAMQLSSDLKEPAGRPVYLFSASEAPWVTARVTPEGQTPPPFPAYITDGPFLHRLRSGTLLMLWSSFGAGGYTVGIARSESGQVTGPWTQDAEPLWSDDGGHSMLFRTFDGRLMLTFHSPNVRQEERAVFVEVAEEDETLRVVGRGSQVPWAVHSGTESKRVEPGPRWPQDLPKRSHRCGCTRYGGRQVSCFPRICSRRGSPVYTTNAS